MPHATMEHGMSRASHIDQHSWQACTSTCGVGIRVKPHRVPHNECQVVTEASTIRPRGCVAPDAVNAPVWFGHWSAYPLAFPAGKSQVTSRCTLCRGHVCVSGVTSFGLVLDVGILPAGGCRIAQGQSSLEQLWRQAELPGLFNGGMGRGAFCVRVRCSTTAQCGVLLLHRGVPLELPTAPGSCITVAKYCVRRGILAGSRVGSSSARRRTGQTKPVRDVYRHGGRPRSNVLGYGGQRVVVTAASLLR